MASFSRVHKPNGPRLLPARRCEQTRTEQPNRYERPPDSFHRRDVVFCRPEGGYYTPDKVSVRVTELVAKAGLPGVGLHALRHSHASELLSKGAPIPSVAKRLGHANANVTLSIYSHALEADELAAAKIWNDAMADVIGANRKLRVNQGTRNTSAKLREA